MPRPVTEEDLRERLATSSMIESEIDKLLEHYLDASAEENIPDMELIADLVEKDDASRVLRVSFTLTSEQYEALRDYFQDSTASTNNLVKRAIDEFLDLL